MDKVEVLEVVRVTEEVETTYSPAEATTPKKRKGKAQEESVDKPKKPRSAYLLYYFDVHHLMQAGNPNMPQSEVNRRISESWKRLSVAEKSYYLEKAKLEKEGIDTLSLSPCKHLPGFRKILPRANCFIVPKSSSSTHQPGASLSEVTVESLDISVEGGVQSVSFNQDSQFTPLSLVEEVEVMEDHIVVGDVAEEMAVASSSLALQGIPASSSFKTASFIPSSPVSQGSADYIVNGVTLKGNETRVTSNCYSGALVQSTQEETTQVMAIVPSQNPLEPKPADGSLHPVMMFSFGGKSEQSVKPSYKMSVKTYTRRGRGRCLNPGCSFMYVTRHKPPTCPECGSHLGGKWIPAAKRTQETEAASKQSPQTAETEQNESCEAAPPLAQEGGADIQKPNTTGSDKKGQAQRCSRKKQEASSKRPLDGSSTKPQTESKKVKDNPKGKTIQNRSTAVVQRRPVRPILPAFCKTGGALIQIVTVPPDKGKFQAVNYNKSSAEPRESFSGLKPNTLKQLGQAIPASTMNQDCSAPSDRNHPVSSLTDKRLNVLSLVPFKQNATSSFDLGLSTARGRGRCKNPSCDYMYKNRHKPAVCPKCGCELTQKKDRDSKSMTLLDPYQALSPAQMDVQRQSTLQLLRHSLQIPESETELQETLNLIHELNTLKMVLVEEADLEQKNHASQETLLESGWPRFYESEATRCGLCCSPLFKGDQNTVAGQEDCCLLTETLMQTASLQLKMCLNVQCLALHSFTDLHPGLFNVGNRLLISIDLFLKIRANIRLGQSPAQAARTVFDNIPSHPVLALSPEESSQIQELLLSGYWAFECLTVRDYNDMICGICGIAPKLEIAQRNSNNVLELKNVEFTWPECSISDEVHVDDFWLTMESEAIEQAAFPADIPITRVDASIIAPFAPPLMRNSIVINTEKDKVQSEIQQPSGDPSVLVRLIHDGQLRLDKIEDHNEDELRTMLDRCGASLPLGATKNELLASLINLYTLVHSGLPTAPQPPAHLTAGKLSKICPHKVVCSSKYLVRGETARDHVDLLVSSRYWPPVYLCDSVRQVALCADLQYPELAVQMWGRNQGCFSDPFEKPEFVSCPELQDQPYSAELSLAAENQQVHPITKRSSCWMLHPPGAAQEPAAPEHHSMLLCRDLEPYVSVVAELVTKKKEEENEAAGKDSEDSSSPMVFNNTAYYYLHNRLVDFLTSRDIVSQQISQVVKACQPGEVVIRDTLYRLGVAQINTERDDNDPTVD
ncbi:HMG domain-containing protein 3 isoform X2 [Cololabis saira]|uniref:HMG domain-containing protein 3 isoform X2 n=1 Tax=Cololabis saira TaxID=129043 RepID=UPI002AD5280B|nr:HMG domain-containing protein 3 isoform X2 [Cololabis saira]